VKMLITGATGFVGSWLTKKLLDLGHEVRVISRSGEVNFSFPHDKLEVLKGDIGDLGSLVRATENIHTVFHLAGVVGYSRAIRQQMHQTNVLGTANILEAFKQSNCSRFLHMSSVVAIGASIDGRNVLNEESPFNLHQYDLGYFETKKAAEDLVKHAVLEGVDAVIVNPSTIYGAGDATKGSRSTQIKVARGKFPFYSSGGVNVIHIDDLVEGVYKAWKMGRTGERYILAGDNLRIKDLFEMIATAAHVQPPKYFLPDSVILAIGKIGDALENFNKKGPLNSENARASIMYHWFDNAKARTELGLQARPAKEAIQDSVVWMKQNGII
jgi:dihydroflavonol-4-reductase